MKNRKGITLIALVVTIIVLLILASISLNLVLGDHGLITIAKKAKENMELAQIEEQTELNTLYEQLYGNSIGDSENSGDSSDSGDNENSDNSENTQGGETETPDPPTKIPTTVEEAAKQNQTFDENITVQDEYNNSVVIPAGFHIVMPEEDNTVEYNYTGNNNPSVQDGIVVEDNDDNQFVWIPVGEIKGKNESKTTITLGRYEDNKYTGNASDAKDGAYVINTYFTEDTASTHNNQYGNTIAENINAFIKSANTNGGYFLARYEASYDGEGDKPLSQPARYTISGSYKGRIWNSISQPEAAAKSKAMYGGNGFSSDLVNSYAWDTAIVFIQKFSEGNANYANQTSRNKNFGNTGERKSDNSTDKVCNIYDMASNCYEWTTETSSNIDYSAANHASYRGGVAHGDTYDVSHAGYRYYATSNAETNIVTFRVTLYINV